MGNVDISYGCNMAEAEFSTSRHGSITVGRFTSISKSSIISGNTKITIGSFNSIIGTCFVATGHDYDRFTTYYIKSHLLNESKEESLYSKGEINIGNDVWIGTNSVILSNVTIGTGAVIGAGSVITHDLEPYGIYAGIPAKLIRYRFPEEICSALLESQWWNADIESLKKLAALSEKKLTSNWDTLKYYFADLANLAQLSK